MGNCQAAEAATVEIQHPGVKKVERIYCSVSANEIMNANPGHYVALVVTAPPLENGAVKQLKLLRPDDTLVIGQVYRLVSFEDVLKEFSAKNCVKLGKLLRERRPLKRTSNLHSAACVKVKHLQLSKEDLVCRDLKLVGSRSNMVGVTYQSYVVNGFTVHSRELELKRRKENIGVSIKAATSGFCGIRDENLILSDLDCYGVITKIIELCYVDHMVVLFRCDWVSKGRRLKQDSDGSTLANFSNIGKILYTNSKEEFVYKLFL